MALCAPPNGLIEGVDGSVYGDFYLCLQGCTTGSGSQEILRLWNGACKHYIAVRFTMVDTTKMLHLHEIALVDTVFWP